MVKLKRQHMEVAVAVKHKSSNGRLQIARAPSWWTGLLLNFPNRKAPKHGPTDRPLAPSKTIIFLPDTRQR